MARVRDPSSAEPPRFQHFTEGCSLAAVERTRVGGVVFHDSNRIRFFFFPISLVRFYKTTGIVSIRWLKLQKLFLRI